MKSPGRGMPGHSEEPRYRKTLPKGVDTYGLQSVSVLVRAQRLPDQPWKPRHGRGFGADGFDGFVLRRKNALSNSLDFTQTIGQLRRRRRAPLPALLESSTPSHAGLLWEPQGLVQMRVVEDIPEPIYGFAMRPRLIAEYALDLSQRKRENCVAAALQR